MKVGGFAAWETPDLVAKRDALLKKKEKRLSNPEAADLERIELVLRGRGVVQAQVQAVLTPAAPERELSNAERLRNAIDEAKRLNLVTTEEGGDLSSTTHAYLLPSGHYGASAPIPSVSQSQYQLFAFMHLLTKHGVTSPFFPEGTKSDRVFQKTAITDIGPFRGVNAYGQDVQEYLISHPRECMAYFEQIAKQGFKMGFSAVTAYAHKQGIHCPEVWEQVFRVLPRLHIEDSFIGKYGLITAFHPNMQMIGGQAKICINGHMIDPREFINDCNEFIQFAEELAACDIAREKEVAECFVNNAGKEPIAWLGLGHEEDVLRHSKDRGIHVTSVIPTATVPARQSGEKGDVSARTAPFIRQYRDWALELLPQ